jgi:class 3 adenylate cyclase/HAMP domain-containing protein
LAWPSWGIRSLVVKNVVMFVVIVIAVVTPIAVTYLRSVENLLTRTLAAQIAVAAQRGSAMIDVRALPGLEDPARAGSAEYRKLRETLARIQSEFGVDNAVDLRRLDSGRYAYIADGSGNFKINEDVALYDNFPETKPAADEAWRTGEPGQTALFSSEESKWFQINTPLGVDGRVVALLLINKFATPVAEDIRQRQIWIVSGVLAILVMGIGVWGFFTHRVLRPLVNLRRAATQISQGTLDVEIAPYGARDEVGDLTAAFQQMVVDLKTSRRLLQLEKDSFFRFVPTQFLELLGRKSATEINVGDSLQLALSVMFTDIRSFTTISESLDARQVFGFLNEYLAKMDPAIRSQGGFVDKFLGDGIMALFADDPAGGKTASDLAVNAAVAMRRELAQFNVRRKAAGLPKVRIGIGIHTGPLVLGTVGSTSRLNTTVVGDTVNLASRIEGRTDHFGMGLAITDAVYHGLSDRRVHDLREIGWVQVKGKSKPVTLIEVYDWEEDAVRAVKTESRPLFANGLALYRKGEFRPAGDAFHQVFARNANDVVSERYLRRCQQFAARPPIGPWRGVDVFTVK